MIKQMRGEGERGRERDAQIDDDTVQLHRRIRYLSRLSIQIVRKAKQ